MVYYYQQVYKVNTFFAFFIKSAQGLYKSPRFCNIIAFFRKSLIKLFRGDFGFCSISFTKFLLFISNRINSMSTFVIIISLSALIIKTIPQILYCSDIFCNIIFLFFFFFYYFAFFFYI